MSTNKTLLLATAGLVAVIFSPIVADAASRHGHANRHAGHQRAPITSNAGHAAFGMYIAPSTRFNPNSPAATGGGSLGYNHKLLIY